MERTRSKYKYGILVGLIVALSMVAFYCTGRQNPVAVVNTYYADVISLDLNSANGLVYPYNKLRFAKVSKEDRSWLKAYMSRVKFTVLAPTTKNNVTSMDVIVRRPNVKAIVTYVAVKLIKAQRHTQSEKDWQRELNRTATEAMLEAVGKVDMQEDRQTVVVRNRNGRLMIDYNKAIFFVDGNLGKIAM